VDALLIGPGTSPVLGGGFSPPVSVWCVFFFFFFFFFTGVVSSVDAVLFESLAVSMVPAVAGSFFGVSCVVSVSVFVLLGSSAGVSLVGAGGSLNFVALVPAVDVDVDDLLPVAAMASLGLLFRDWFTAPDPLLLDDSAAVVFVVDVVVVVVVFFARIVAFVSAVPPPPSFALSSAIMCVDVGVGVDVDVGLAAAAIGAFVDGSASSFVAIAVAVAAVEGSDG